MKKISVINAKIRRLNLKAEYTKFFNELGKNEKEIIEKEVVYINDEEPIFCFFSKIEYWWVITNLRIVICENNIVTYNPFEEIIQVQLNDIFEGEISKEECQNLEINLRNGEEIKINVEKNTWYAIYNIIKFLALSDSYAT